MEEGPEVQPAGSAYLLNADAQAIFEEAPNLDLGLELLNEAYSSKKWDDEEKAKEVAAEYAQLLRYRFEDITPYTEADIQSLAPVDLSDIPATEEGPEKRITDWEEANLQFLNETKDPDYLLVREKLKESVGSYASILRRDVHGKDESWLEDKFFRVSLGLTGSLAKLVGADGYVKALQERTDPSRDDDLSSAFASGGGSVIGAIGGGIVGGVVGGPPGAAVGAGSYLFGSGAGEVRETYEQALQRTGDSNRALVAGAIETGSQALQTVVGAKIFGSTGKAIAKKIFGGEAQAITQSALRQVTSKGLTEGAAEAAGNVISNYADKYGTKNPNIDIFDETGTNFLVGAVFGSGAGAVDAVIARSNPVSDPGTNPVTGITEPIEQSVIGGDVDIAATEALKTNAAELTTDTLTPAFQADVQVASDFTTVDGSQYALTEDGATRRFKEKTQEEFSPLDRTFIVDKERAVKLAALRNVAMPDGKSPQILTDGETLLVKGEFINEDLTISKAPTGRRLTSVRVESEPAPGLYPVEVNRPKNLNGNQREYRSHIGQEIREFTPRIVKVEQAEGRSVGAAFTKERKLGARLRLSRGLEEQIRTGFGDEEFGYLRYMPQPRAETANLAEQFIAERGVERATVELLSLPENYGDAQTIDAMRQLVKFYNEGVRNANAENNVAAAEEMSDVAVHLGEKAAQILTNAGRTVDIARLWSIFDPGLRVMFVRKQLSDAALKTIASEEGKSLPELKRTDRDLQKVQEKLSSVPEEGRTEAEEATFQDLSKKQTDLTRIRDKIRRTQKERQAKFTPEQQERMTKLLTAAGKTSGSTQQLFLEEALKIEQEIGAKEKLPSADLLHTYWQLNLLSGPGTQAVNFIGNSFQTLGTALSYLTTGVPVGNLDGLSFIKGVIDGARGEGAEAFWAELQGIKTFRPEAQKLERGSVKSPRGVSARFDPVTDFPEWTKKIGLNNLGYAFRALSATDALFYKGLQEGQARFLAHQLARQEGLSGKDLTARISEILFKSTDNFNEALKTARNESKLLEELGRPISERQVKLRAWEILEEQRPESLREQTHTFASKSTFTNTPEGVIGQLVRAMHVIGNAPIRVGGREIKPFRYLFPFMNVAGNLLNANLDYVPIVGGPRALGLTGLKGVERRNAAGKFLLGSMLAGTVYGLARSFADDENPYIDLTAFGPRDANQRKQLQSQGWRPFSVKIGDSYFRYSETPLGVILGALGAWLDQEKYNKAYGRKSGLGALGIVLGGMGRAFVDNSFLRNISDFVAALSGDERVNIIDALVVNPVKGFVPGVGALRSVAKMVENPIDTYDDYWAKFVSGIPFVQSIGTRPALNAFGEPVERTFEDRLDFIGRFYSQRVTDPTWRWLSENGYTVPNFGVELSVKGRPSVAKKRAEDLGAAFEGVMTTDERYEFLEKSGPLIKDKVEEYRKRYGSAGFQKKVQEQLSEDIGKIRSRVKQNMFLR